MTNGSLVYEKKGTKRTNFFHLTINILTYWMLNVFLYRQEILERRMAKRQRRQDMAKRRTAAAQERMRIISQLARKEKRDDDFGMRDEDWDVYKVINRVQTFKIFFSFSFKYILKLCF